MEKWVLDNWVDILTGIGIIGGLLFSADARRSETKSRRETNHITLTKENRELWTTILNHSELERLLDRSADVRATPPTVRETIQANLQIQHLFTVFESLKNDLTIRLEALQTDVQFTLSFPVMHAVWEKLKVFHNRDFVEFVEKCLRGGQTS